MRPQPAWSARVPSHRAPRVTGRQRVRGSLTSDVRRLGDGGWEGGWVRRGRREGGGEAGCHSAGFTTVLPGAPLPSSPSSPSSSSTGVSSSSLHASVTQICHRYIYVLPAREAKTAYRDANKMELDLPLPPVCVRHPPPPPSASTMAQFTTHDTLHPQSPPTPLSTAAGELMLLCSPSLSLSV